jgi:hypothetical protein
MKEPYWMPTSAPKDAQGTNSDFSFANAGLGAYVFLIAGSATAIILFVIFLREIYWRKYGVDISPGCLCCRRRDDHLESDRALAEEVQRRFNEEEREAERITKQNERRVWYESYMKKFTMVRDCKKYNRAWRIKAIISLMMFSTQTAESKDLFFAQELDDPAIHKQEENKNDHVPQQPEVVSRLRKRLPSNFSEISDEEINDIESSGPTRKACVAVACDEQDKDAQLYLRLPVKDEKGNFRTVDAECAICFSEYEVGDKVIWSGLQCQHAFHDECIMPWLVKGKKRCPTCRHWFVPGARIDDQKQELEERLRAESEGVASSSESTDDTQDESQSDSEHQGTSVEIATGDDEPALTPSLSSEVDVECGNTSEISSADSP